MKNKKDSLPIALILIVLGLFLIIQFIGLYIAHNANIPEYLAPELSTATQQSPQYYFYQIISSIIFAIIIFVLITKYKLKTFMRLWFFLVVSIALSISISTILFNLFGINKYWIALGFAIILAALKLLRPSMITHNGTEILIYPGIAAIFVPLLNPFFMIILLIIISIYDMWAVWKVGLMQKMAKFQMNELKIFGGLLIPYLTKEIRQKISNYKKSKKQLKVPIAFLGGGDIFYPIFTSGVFYNYFGIGAAIAVIFGAFMGLTFLMFKMKNKPYPAMPFITAGMFLGLLVWLGTRLLL
jgi:presenilin-like A22 family membrane protease